MSKIITTQCSCGRKIKRIWLEIHSYQPPFAERQITSAGFWGSCGNSCQPTKVSNYSQLKKDELPQGVIILPTKYY